MARSNIIEFARSFQESFQRQQQIGLQRQREERFDRQLTANATFQQSQANTQRQQFEQRELRLREQAEISGGFREREFGLAERRLELEEGRFGRSEQTRLTLPPKLAFLGRLSKEGVPAKIIGDIEPLIPDDATVGESPIFFEVAQKLPFFQRTTFGRGKLAFSKFNPGFDVTKEEIAPEFRDFLKSTDFANKPQNEQATILRSFEESLGIDIGGDDPKTAVPRDQVEFDLQSEFFQDIIKAEGGGVSESLSSTFSTTQVGGDPNDITGLSDDELRRIVEGG